MEQQESPKQPTRAQGKVRNKGCGCGGGGGERRRKQSLVKMAAQGRQETKLPEEPAAELEAESEADFGAGNEPQVVALSTEEMHPQSQRSPVVPGSDDNRFASDRNPPAAPFFSLRELRRRTLRKWARKS